MAGHDHKHYCLECYQISGIKTYLLAAQFRWTSYLIRMDNHRIPKQILYSRLTQGSRSCGGQYIRYIVRFPCRITHFVLTNKLIAYLNSVNRMIKAGFLKHWNKSWYFQATEYAHHVKHLLASIPVKCQDRRSVDRKVIMLTFLDNYRGRYLELLNKYVNRKN